MMSRPPTTSNALNLDKDPVMTKPNNVVQFQMRPTFEGEDDAPVTLPPTDAHRAATRMPTSKLDLTGKPKVWFVIGPGRSGKTMLVRWITEICGTRGAFPLVAAADPQNRSLKNYFSNVQEPPTNDATATAKWLEAILRHVTAGAKKSEPVSALIDLGGGDTSLQKMLAGVPDIAAVLDEAGVAPVAVYLLGPRQDDLASLASFEALGFKPAATVLVRNEGLTDPSIDRTIAFARVLRRPEYKAAIERGAVEIWMPRLDPAVAQEIEAKRLSFIQARDAISPEGRSVPPLAPFDRSRVRRFWDEMATDMEPIASWLPQT
jgi:hypothetical protein